MESINNQKFNKLSNANLSKIIGGNESIVTGGIDIYQYKLDSLNGSDEISRVKKTKTKVIGPPNERCFHPDLYYYSGRTLVLKEIFVDIIECR